MISIIKSFSNARVGLWACLIAALVAVPSACSTMSDSFAFLYRSETREPVEQIMAGAKRVRHPTDAADGTLIFTSGRLDGQLTTDPGLWQPNDAVAIFRVTEQYAWSRTEREISERRWGGGRNVRREVDYTLRWQADPSRFFPEEDAPENPPLEWRTLLFAEGELSLDEFQVDPSMPIVGAWQQALPTVDERQGPLVDATEHDGRLYIGDGTPDEPMLGDVRFTYIVMRPGMELSALAVVHGSRLVPYAWYDIAPMIVLTPMSRGDLLKQAKLLDTVFKWLGRAAVFVLLIMAMLILAGPILVVADIIPPIGLTLKVLTVLLAAPISALAVTLGVYFIFLMKNPVILLIILAMIAAILWGWRKAGREIDEARGEG